VSVDCVIHGVPEGIPGAHIAAMLVQWCGTEIATLHDGPWVSLLGVAGEQAEDEWRRGPRGIEVFRKSPRVVWLTLRHADAYTYAVAEGFAVWWARRFGRKNARVEWSTTGRVVWSRAEEGGR
jgi:hypothetical protein